MTNNTINLFMWGYQAHYRVLLGLHAKRVFEALGILLEPKALLIGIRRPEMSDPNPICVEPEDGEWPLVLFDGLNDVYDRIIHEHPLQNMIYGDEPSMQEKPERMRRDSARQAVREALVTFDSRELVRSFCGTASPVDNFYVVPIVQVPEQVFEVFQPLREPIGDERFAVCPSLIHAAMVYLLEDASAELERKDPGRHFGQQMRTQEEIVRLAAASFMKTPGLAIGDRNLYFDLFEQFNVISSLLYEGARGVGRLLLVNPENPVIEYKLRLAEPVPFRVPRWARKILQMASADLALIADCEKIYGLGALKAGHDPMAQDVFTIEFLDHYHWQLRCGEQVLLRSRYGKPALPQEPINAIEFLDTFSRLFPAAKPKDGKRLLALFKVAAAQSHGSMVVVAEDAAEEAGRLTQQGTVVVPTIMTEELLPQVSGIDGTIILDPHGVCHAIGVILDGPAQSDCSPSRGSRYNSAIRYIRASSKARLTIVVSDDHTVDVFPILRPRIEREGINTAIGALEVATLDDYHKPREWLDEHRFYLSGEQCTRVNAALDRIEALPKETGQMVIITKRCEPHPAMNDSYFLTVTPER